jgi:hypothetical protein
MPTNDQRDGKTPSEKPQPLVEDRSAPPISDRGLALAVAALAVALVLGYLLLSKMIDISHQEDCALARRKNCAASEATFDLRHMAAPYQTFVARLV